MRALRDAGIENGDWGAPSALELPPLEPCFFEDLLSTHADWLVADQGADQDLLRLARDWRQWPEAPGLILHRLTNSSSLPALHALFAATLRRWGPGARLRLLALDPGWHRQRGPERWPGMSDTLGMRQRPLRHYLELGRIFGAELELPERIDEARVWLDFVFREDPKKGCALPDSSKDGKERAEARYGMDSKWRSYDRLEEPEALDDLLYGTRAMRLERGDRVLALGVNDGRELELFDAALELDFVGFDLATSAIDAARQRWPERRHEFYCEDLRELSSRISGQFSAILLLNVLQCRTVDREALLRDLRRFMAPRCSVLVSLPNSHFLDFDIARRPLNRADPRHDRSPTLKDLRFLARHFFRSGFADTQLFGTYDWFLLARRDESKIKGDLVHEGL